MRSRNFWSLALNLAAYRIISAFAILKFTPWLYKIGSGRFRRGIHVLESTKTLLYLQNGKAQISISFVSQTKELITDTGNRDQVGLFSNLLGPLPITSFVKTFETCEVELWWLLLPADIFRRQNVEVQCLRGSFAFAWQKKMKKRRGPALIFWYANVSRKTKWNSLYDRVKAPLTGSVYYYNHLPPLPAL